MESATAGIGDVTDTPVGRRLHDRTDRSTNTPRAVKWSVLVAAAALVVYLCLLVLRPFFNVIGWSTVLAITCYPMHQRLVRRTGRAALSAFITSALMVLSVGLPLLLIAAIAVNQLLAIGKSLEQMFLDPHGLSGRATAAFAPTAQRLGLDAHATANWASEHTTELIARAGQYAMSAVADVSGAIVSFAFVVFATFLLLRHGDRLVGNISDLLPFERTRSEALLLRVRDVVHGSMYGVVTIAMVQGALNGGMFWLLAVPAAALWGLVTVFASLVPLVGTAAVWAPGALYLFAIGDWKKAIVLTLWGAAVVSSVDNLLRPRLVAGRIGLSGVAMFVAMLGGLQAFGALGIVLGPVTFAAAAAIVDVLRDTESARRSELTRLSRRWCDRCRENLREDLTHVRGGDHTPTDGRIAPL
jgi:predicted PurR-regulated permease PerM